MVDRPEKTRMNNNNNITNTGPSSTSLLSSNGTKKKSTRRGTPPPFVSSSKQQQQQQTQQESLILSRDTTIMSPVSAACSTSMILPNKPTMICYGPTRFLVMDAPSTNNLPAYLREMHKNHVTALVRVCEPTYDKKRVEESPHHIMVYDWLFPDGEGPPESIIQQWLQLVRQTFYNIITNTNIKNPKEETGGSLNIENDDGEDKDVPFKSIGVHCVAGLGRAPVLVALALIEQGMAPLDAVQYIRERRRGAINSKQLKFLETYKPRHLDWFDTSEGRKSGGGGGGGQLNSSNSNVTTSTSPSASKERCFIQ